MPEWIRMSKAQLVFRYEISCSGRRGEKEREKYIWTLLTAFRAIYRNQRHSNLIGPFRANVTSALQPYKVHIIIIGSFTTVAASKFNIHCVHN